MTVKITHVGQELWYVPNYGTSRSKTVASIGRKWAVLSGLRNKVEISTGIVDGGKYSSPGMLYNSKKDYEDGVMRSKLIWRFKDRVTVRQLENVLTENIIAAAALLGISLEAV